MTEKLQLYRCSVCRNLVEVLQTGEGELVCCGQPMELIQAQEKEHSEYSDKHVPVFEKTVDGYTIRVGTKPHPMIEEHHLDFIQAISKDNKYVKTKFLSLEDAPELNVKCKCDASIWARALCNIHGLFKNEYQE